MNLGHRLVALCTLAVSTAPRSYAGEVAPALRARLASVDPHRSVRVLAYLRTDPRTTSGGIHAMRARAAAAEAPLRKALAASGPYAVHSLWSVRAIAVAAPPKTIRMLAARSDVERVEEDAYIQVPEDALRRVRGEDVNGSWNLERIGATGLWGEGVVGTGVTVGVIDSGVDATHPDLIGKMVAGGWRDFVQAHSSPYDDSGHGTHVTGIICGGAASGTPIGVAPGARFMAAKALDSLNRFYSSWVISSGQWMADPNGDGDPSDAPDIVNCSWLYDTAAYAGFRPVLDLWRSVGIWPVFAAGNRGPGVYTIGSPGSDPYTICVGMTNALDTVADSSSRGPAPPLAPFNGVLKPDVTAPGVMIHSAVPGGYSYATGSSMAAPHVSGALALLKQAIPSLTYEEAYRRLTDGAVDGGVPGPDTAYGHGRIDVMAAVHLVAGTTPSSLSGLVKDSEGRPLAGAVVDASGARAITDLAGQFTIPHVANHAVTVTVDATGYAPLAQMVTPDEVASFVLPVRIETSLFNGDVEQMGGWLPTDASSTLSRSNAVNHTAGGHSSLQIAAGGDGVLRAWRSEPVPIPSGGLVSVHALYSWRATGDANGRTTALEWLDGAGKVLSIDYGTPYVPPTRGGPGDGVWRPVMQAFDVAPPMGASGLRLLLGAVFAPEDIASHIWFDDASVDLIRAPGSAAVTGLVLREGETAANAVVGEHPFGTYFVQSDGRGRYVLVMPAGSRVISAWSPGLLSRPGQPVNLTPDGVESLPAFTLIPAGTNAAPAGTHAASSTLDMLHLPDLGADGRSDTAWISAVGSGATPDAPIWWSVDLGTVRGIQSLEIEWETAPNAARVAVSSDGVQWTPVVQGNGPGWRMSDSRTVSVVTLDGTSTRHLRIEDIGSSALGRVGLWEVRVHPTPSTRLGDVDDSGTVTLADAVAVLAAAGGLGQMPMHPGNGDVAPAGGDSRLTVLDAVAITRLIPQFPSRGGL